jgi:hypothetical protein
VRWFLILLVACGSAPPPVQPVAPEPSKPAAPFPASPGFQAARVTCADAGTILRGAVEDSRKAGPAKEAAIASACLYDKWTQAVLDCIGTEATEPRTCLEQLSVEQRTTLDTKMQAWIDIYSDETWETAADEEAAEPEIACAGIIGDVAGYAPLTAVGEERDFAIKVRRHVVLASCEKWPRAIRQCFQTGAIPACRAKLAPEIETPLASSLGSLDAVLGRIAEQKKKPATTYDCKAVVARHYSDGAWKGQAEVPRDPKATRADLAKIAAQRKQMIADSRKAMLDACTGEAWTATQRACELVGGKEMCRQALGRGDRWGFPAAGVISETGIIECNAYAQAVAAWGNCGKVPQQAKDAMKQAFDSMRDSFKKTTDPQQRQALATACKQGDEAIRQAMASLGCAP